MAILVILHVIAFVNFDHNVILYDPGGKSHVFICVHTRSIQLCMQTSWCSHFFFVQMRGIRNHSKINLFYPQYLTFSH